MMHPVPSFVRCPTVVLLVKVDANYLVIASIVGRPRHHGYVISILYLGSFVIFF